MSIYGDQVVWPEHGSPERYRDYGCRCEVCYLGHQRRETYERGLRQARGQEA